MPDAKFADARLAAIYDLLDSDRSDLDAYVAMAEEFGARSVLDVGCGTGVFACMLAERGIEVVGVDPAGASIDVARGKAWADTVRWIHGDATALPPLQVDLATMTGNVAQVFLSDDDWSATLKGIRAALKPGGLLVFETRDPAQQAWLRWNTEDTYSKVDIPGPDSVECWSELRHVGDSTVTFRGNYIFASDGARMISDSTLRFRSRGEIERSLVDAGFRVDGVRDAPDRPGLEFVFVASVG